LLVVCNEKNFHHSVALFAICPRVETKFFEVFTTHSAYH